MQHSKPFLRLAKPPPQQGYSTPMDFDARLATHLHQLRFSTWYIEGTHIQVAHPYPFTLQGLRLTPRPHASAPRGVAWLHAPGPYADLTLTSIRARTATDLQAERERLQRYLGSGWDVLPLEDQMPLVSAALRGQITEPSNGLEPALATSAPRVG